MPGELVLLAARNFQAFLCFGRGYFEPFWYLPYYWASLFIWFIRHFRCKAKAIFKVMPDRNIYRSGMI